MNKGINIPTGWIEVRIGNLCKSLVPGRNKPKIFDGDIPWVNTPDINSRYIPLSNHAICITKEEVKNCGGKIVPAGAVVMACVGDLGLVAITIKDIVINQQLHAFVCPENIYNEYIAYSLKAQKSQMYKLASLTTIPYLNKSNCESLEILLPPLQEQKAIADILEKWDEAIEKTSKLIEEKKKRFEWIRTELLDQFKNKNWQISRLSKISTIKKGEQLNRSELEGFGDYPAWNGGINPSGYTDKWNTLENTITISEGGNSCGFVNYCEQKFWCGGHCYSLLDVSKKIDPEFLYYFLKSKEKSIMRLRVGSGLPNIQKKDIDKLEVSYPELPQQKQIAKTLNTAKKEITILEEILGKYKSQKKGLMQKLLTGKIRVLHD